MNRPGSDHDGFGADRERVLPRACCDSRGAATLEGHSSHLTIDDDARAARGRILQIRDQRRLLRAAPAAHPAVAARVVLRAASHIARQQAVMPAELLDPANQDLVPPRRFRVLDVDAETGGNGLDGAREFGALEMRKVVLMRPFVADRGWSCET